jgi:hypothetical protein
MAELPAATPVPPLSDGEAFGWIVLGIVLSVLVPIAVKILKSATVRTPRPNAVETMKEKMIRWGKAFGEFARPYVLVAFASVILGGLILLLAKQQGVTFSAWHQAVLAGYIWDSTLQKIKEGASS